jgi:hypothetical protein
MIVSEDSLIRRYPLISYFSLCFLIAWSVWIPVGILAPDKPALTLPGAWAPTLGLLLLAIGFNVLLGGSPPAIEAIADDSVDPDGGSGIGPVSANSVDKRG